MSREEEAVSPPSTRTNTARSPKSDALAERLAGTVGIAVVCAPPGFGKSTLVASAAALAARDPATKVTAFDAARHLPTPQGAAEAILAAGAEDIVVVDGLRGADADAISDALIARFPSPEQPRVWIAMHYRKDVALARLMAAGAVQTFDWRSLRLTDAGVRTRTDRVPQRFRRAVFELGGTWPAASALLCRWAQEAPADEADWEMPAILEASGLGEYIEQEVAPLLSGEELDALVHASISDTIQLDGDKRGVTRSHEVQALLRASGRIAGLVDRQGDTLIIHPALRNWLAVKFEELPRDEQLDSLARAAEAFARRGDLVVAARLYKGAAMELKIERLAIDGGSLLIWMTHGFSAIRELVEQAGPAVVAGSRVLQLMQCIILMKTGQIGEAKQLFAALDSDRRRRDEISERDREVVRAALSVYGCELQSSSDLDRFRVLVARSADLPDWKSFLATLSCILDVQSARFDPAMASLIDARVHARNARSRYNLLFLSLHEASLHLARGTLKKAREALADARKRWRQEFADDRGAETVMSALAASLEYELGQLTSARASTRRSAYRMPDTEAWFDIYAAAYEPMARLVAADHGQGPALEALADQRRRLEAQGLPRVAALLQNLAIVIAGERFVRDGDEAGAFPDAGIELAPVASAPTWQERETFTLASAYLDVRDGRTGHAERLLRDGIAVSGRLGLDRSNLRYRLALAAILLRAGDARVPEELGSALELAARLGARQVFSHFMSPPFASALTRAAAAIADRSPEVARFMSGLGASRRTALGNPTVDLSSRELEVVKVLSEGGSDKVIGRILNMSEHGVRFHLKSIYRKLNVHNRVSAIQRAREAGALPST